LLMERTILTMQELIKHFKVSRQTVYLWRDEGMPYLQLNKMVRYDLEDVMNWLIERGKQNTK